MKGQRLREEHKEAGHDQVARPHDSRSDGAARAESADRPTRRLQQSLGNQAVQRLAEAGAIQPKATVRAPDDPAEHEADRIADTVVGGGGRRPIGGSTASRSTNREGGDGTTSGADRAVRAVQGGGQPLPRSVRADFEGAFGRDMSDVRVHTGGEADRAARSIDARAYTTGSDIAFRRGEYQPDSRDGKRLLAHELTHVVQQGAAGDRIQRQSSGGGSAGGTRTTGGMSMASGDTSGGMSVAPGASSGGRSTGQSGGGGQAMGGYTTTGTGGTGGMSMMVPPSGPGAQSIQNTPWYLTGNLNGDVPVRDRANPPNKHVVEDQAVWEQRRDMAERFHQRQQKRTTDWTDSGGNVTDYRYWFAELYQRVTRNEIEHAEGGNFYYPSQVMAWVNYFEQMYHDNLEAAQTAGEEAEQHWQTAFETAAVQEQEADTWFVNEYVNAVMESMISSVKAHLRYDLPRALTWVFNRYGRQFQNASMGDFRPDFFAMGNVFKNAAWEMNRHIRRKAWIPADGAPPTLQDFMMRQYGMDLASERAETWKRAKMMAEGGQEGAGPYSGGQASMQGDVTRGQHTEGLQGIGAQSGSGISPSMTRSSPGLDPGEVNRIVNESSPEELASYSPVHRIRMTNAILGSGGGARILKILRASVDAGLVDIVNGIEPLNLLDGFDSGTYDAARTLLNEHYWPETDHYTAVFGIKQCLDGPTPRWQASVILDILKNRDDRREVVATLAEEPQYSDREGTSAFDRGLGLLTSNLDWGLETELEELFGTEASTDWW